MTETKKTTAPKKTTGTRKATSKKTVEPASQSENNPLLDLLSGLSPDQLANLVALAQQPQTEVVARGGVDEPSKPKRITKSYLTSAGVRDREVDVRSVCNGRVTYRSQKSGVTYVWTQKDDVESMTVGEIVGMAGRSPKFLQTPWLIVEDEEVNEGLGLNVALEIADLFDNLNEVLELPYYQLKQRVESLSAEQKSQLADQISLKIQNSELRDIVLIRNLQELLGTEFLEIK